MKRAIWPSFLLFPAFIFALLTSILASYFNYWCGVVCLLLLLCFRTTEKFNWSYLSLAVIAYTTIVVTNLIFIDTAYTAEDFYYIAYLLIAFIIFSKLSVNQTIHIYKLLVYVFIVLTVWALVQYYTGDFYIVKAGMRSNTIFTTANTFAAAVNLILFPLIAMNLSRKNKLLCFIVMLLLFYALLVSRSRGGMLSFLIGYCAIFTFIFANKLQNKMAWKKVSLGLFSVFLLFLSSHLIDWRNNQQGNEFDFFEISRMEGVSDHSTQRLVLYESAWQRIKQKPLLGHGYHNFQFYWLADQRPPFKNSTTKFVHNDYLQIWLEVGIFGLVAMLMIIIIIYLNSWYKIKQCDDHLIPYILSIVGGLSGYFAHAMVDFVIYPCFLTLLFGAYLGLAVRVFNAPGVGVMRYIQSIINKLNINWNSDFWRIFICALAIVWFSQPYVAELAFKRAEKYISQVRVEESLPLYELARRFAPYNAFYYAVEATYWRMGVIHSGEGELTAQRANQLFLKGAQANPFDVKNSLSRAVLNRDYPELLDSPADNETILKWFEHVLFWEPNLIAGQVEYVRTLIKFNQEKKAKELFEKYIINNPDSEDLQKLREEFLI